MLSGSQKSREVTEAPWFASAEHRSPECTTQDLLPALNHLLLI